MSGIVLSAPDGTPVPTGPGVNGAIVVTLASPTPTGTPTPTPTATLAPTATATATATVTATATQTVAPAAVIDIGSATGAPNGRVGFDVTLVTGGDVVVATQVDMTFDPSAAVDVTAEGRPDCAVNPEINKDATSFNFLPSGCTPGVTCDGVRALVLSLDNLDPIPDGATLFTCVAAIASTATIGSHPLVCSAAEASSGSGALIPIACNSGSVVVEQPCVGDCNGDHQVSVDEVILGVNIILGEAALESCPALDVDHDHMLAINEVVQAVGNALNGCPAS